MKDESSDDGIVDDVVNGLYDIALDPASLEGFIDAWNGAGLHNPDVRRHFREMQDFDAAFGPHISRAVTFLERNHDEGPLSAADILRPFQGAAAFLVNASGTVVACNAGAQTALNVAEGGTLDPLPLDETCLDRLRVALSALKGDDDRSGTLLGLQIATTGRPVLFHMRRLADACGKGRSMVLVVTTLYHWQPGIGHVLADVFQLTLAEQGVVRALLEGHDAKAIAAARGTSEGTVRSQIKSILSKMNIRTQAEVLRLVLSLRDMVGSDDDRPAEEGAVATPALRNWLDAEVWKPFRTITLPDGRRMDYHDQGPLDGAPVLYSHMGYGMARWTKPMLKLAFRHRLRIICPIRAGYGRSDNLHRNDDVLRATREDTRSLCDHLGIRRLPYVAQGNDLLFAVDFAAEWPERISEIAGLCARPCLPGGALYKGMAKWHRFFLSTAQHAPHLLGFSSRAAVSMARRIGIEGMYRKMNGSSPADMRLLDDDETYAVLHANGQLVASQMANVAQAYAMEILRTESDWSGRILAARETPIWSVNGGQDPALDPAILDECREAYPWIEFELIENAGQMLIYQHYETLIPRIASAAHQVA